MTAGRARRNPHVQQDSGDSPKLTGLGELDTTYPCHEHRDIKLAELSTMSSVAGLISPTTSLPAAAGRGQRLDFGFYTGTAPASASLPDFSNVSVGYTDGGQLSDTGQQSGSNNTSYNFQTTATYNGVDWNETNDNYNPAGQWQTTSSGSGGSSRQRLDGLGIRRQRHGQRLEHEFRYGLVDARRQQHDAHRRIAGRRLVRRRLCLGLHDRQLRLQHHGELLARQRLEQFGQPWPPSPVRLVPCCATNSPFTSSTSVSPGTGEAISTSLTGTAWASGGDD